MEGIASVLSSFPFNFTPVLLRLGCRAARAAVVAFHVDVRLFPPTPRVAAHSRAGANPVPVSKARIKNRH
jgi:hypothetical protein